MKQSKKDNFLNKVIDSHHRLIIVINNFNKKKIKIKTINLNKIMKKI